MSEISLRFEGDRTRRHFVLGNYRCALAFPGAGVARGRLDDGPIRAPVIFGQIMRERRFTWTVCRHTFSFYLGIDGLTVAAVVHIFFQRIPPALGVLSFEVLFCDITGIPGNFLASR